MEVLGPLLTLLSIIGVVILGKAAVALVGDRRARSRDAERAEERRVRLCNEAVRSVLNQVGYQVREAVDRTEVEALIAGGATADEVGRFLADRCRDLKGIELGYHPLGEAAIPVKLPESYRTRHVYVVGKSGSGKTTLLRNLIVQDLAAGSGLGVIAPELEFLEEEILPFVPEHRLDDVVYVNPADTDCPVPFNPLHVEDGEDLDLKVDETLTIFHRAFAEDGSGAAPRMEAILRQGLYTLMQIPGSTLLDLPRLLDRADGTYREWALGQVDDPEAAAFWRSTYPAFPKDAHLPLTNRLGRFLRPRVVRSLLCQPAGSLSIRAAMDAGKVLLFNLSDGTLGEANATLLGQLVVAKVQLAAMSRANVGKEDRPPFYLYVDEFQAYCGVAGASYEKLLSRARKYGLGLILAHQQTGQIPEQIMREILGNVSTVVTFAVGASDARRLGRELVGEVDGVPVPVDPAELLSLRVGESFCKIGRSVFFMPTPPPPTGGSAAVRAEVVRRSRERYGVRQAAGVPRRAAAREVAGTGSPLDVMDPGKVF